MSRPAAFAVGKFDALHRGHRTLVDAAQALGPPVILTFSGMAEVLGWEPRRPLLAPRDRARILTEWLVTEQILPFIEVRPLPPAAFLARLRALGASALVVGRDFRFGRDRAAGAAEAPELARQAGIFLSIVDPLLEQGVPVSSSLVRAALAQGDVVRVASLLGRPYRLCGQVVRGAGRGRQLGFPTANCGELANQAPAAGVYAAQAWIAGSGPWPAAVNAGQRPTIGDDRSFTVEAHLIGYSGDCYGAMIDLDLVARLRDERRFPDLEALRTQIAGDVAAASRVAGCGQPVRR